MKITDPVKIEIQPGKFFCINHRTCEIVDARKDRGTKSAKGLKKLTQSQLKFINKKLEEHKIYFENIGLNSIKVSVLVPPTVSTLDRLMPTPIPLRFPNLESLLNPESRAVRNHEILNLFNQITIVALRQMKDAAQSCADKLPDASSNSTLQFLLKALEKISPSHNLQS